MLKAAAEAKRLADQKAAAEAAQKLAEAAKTLGTHQTAVDDPGSSVTGGPLPKHPSNLPSCEIPRTPTVR
jgi:membrane protein involved in colicin uptake